MIGARRHASPSSSARSALFRFVPQQFFPASSRAGAAGRPAACPKAARSPRRSTEAQKLEAMLDRGDRASRATSTLRRQRAARASTCRSTSSSRSRTSRSSCSSAKNNDDRERVRDAPARAVRRRLSGAARARLAPGERSAGRLPGAVPRVRRRHRARCAAIAQQGGATSCARDPDDVATCSSTGTSRRRSSALEIDQNKARAARHLVAGPRGVPQQRAVAASPSPTSASATSRSRSCCAAPADERARMSFLKDLAIPSRNGKRGADHADRRHPLRARGRHRLAAQPAADDHRARRRARRRAGARRHATRSIPQLDALRAALPLGYRIEIGGAIEDSARGQKSIAAGVPLLVIVVLTLLMIQLQSFSRTVMVVLTAPLGLIGVVARAARVRQAVRLRRDARHDRAVRASSCATR